MSKGDAKVGNELAGFFKDVRAQGSSPTVDQATLTQQFGLSDAAARVLVEGDRTEIEKHMKAAGLEQPNIFWPPGGM